MSTKNEGESCCTPMGENSSCCKIESIVTVDERGQLLLPKEIRDRAGIRAGDKFALIGVEADGQICCLTLLKADDLADAATEKLGPLVKVIVRKRQKKEE